MLDGGYGDLYILDSTRYRSLYIAKVYENTNKKLEEKDELELQFDILKVQNNSSEDPLEFDENAYELVIDQIGLS
jgi:hypothetical protein